MEICHFFVIFYDFVMKCVYKSTIYTFVIRDKIWTPPLCCTKVYMLLLCFGSRKHPPHPIHVRHFCVSPPPTLYKIKVIKIPKLQHGIYLTRENYGVFYQDWEIMGGGKYSGICPKTSIFPGHDFTCDFCFAKIFLNFKRITRFFLSQMHLPAL